MPQIIDQAKASLSVTANSHQYAQQLQHGPEGARVMLCRVPVWTESSDRLVAQGCSPVWNWVKPESQYRPFGSWKADFGAAVKDGEYGAGNGFRMVSYGEPADGQGVTGIRPCSVPWRG